MITASHNPSQYNGYKVYWSDGCQVTAPHDEGIIEEVQKIQDFDQIQMASQFEEVGAELDDLYLQEVKRLQLRPEVASTPLKIIYSNLHGTGIRLLPKALQSWGYTDLLFVEEQKSLDGNFPNAKSPNPEEDKALELGKAQLKQKKADLFLATDPDADRLGVVVQNTKLTGNQTACICLYYILKTLQEKQELPENGAVIKTIVTTELFRKIAQAFAVTCIDVLTGFKYIGEQIRIWESSFDGYQYLFGAEESYGYLFGTYVRDKDAISSACLVVELSAYLKQQNKTLLDLLYDLYRQFGVHREALKNIAFDNTQAGMDQMNSLMARLRKNPPTQIGSVSVQKMEDYLEGKDNLPPSNVLRFWLQDQSKIVIRPSGTEPKIKIYAEVVLPFPKEIQEADQQLHFLLQSFVSFLQISH